MEKERQLQHSNPLIQNSPVDLGSAATTAPSVHHLTQQIQIQHHATGTTLEHLNVYPLPPQPGMEIWPPQPHDAIKNDLDAKNRKRKFFCNHCRNELDPELIENIISDIEKPRKKQKVMLSNIPSTPTSNTSSACTTPVSHSLNDSIATPSPGHTDFLSEKKKQKNQRAEQKDIITTFARIIMTESDASYAKSPLPKDAVFALYEKHVKTHPIPYHVFWRYVLGKNDNKKQKPLWGVNVQSSRKGGSRGILGVRFRNVDEAAEKNMFDYHLEVLNQHGVTLDVNGIIEDLRTQYETHRPKSIPQYHHHTKVEHPQPMTGTQSEIDSKNNDMIISTEMSPSFALNSAGRVLKVRIKGTDFFRRVAISHCTIKELVEKIQQKFGIDSSAIREIREIPDVILVDDGDVHSLGNNTELEITVQA